MATQSWGAGHIQPERVYQAQWCSERGQTEVLLSDGSRCDCLTADYAVEVDFGPKWAEAVGQSLNYAAGTGRKPGIVLIIERPSDLRYLARIRAVNTAFRLGLTVWIVGPAVPQASHVDGLPDSSYKFIGGVP